MKNSIRFLAAAFVAFGFAATAIVPASAQTGRTQTVTRYLYGLNQTGSRNPAKDPACRAKFGHLLGMTATTTYNIDPKTLMERAEVQFMGKVYNLHPLGLSSSYSFGVYFKPPSQPLNAYGVLYSISKQFTNPSNTFILVLDPTTNCALSSKP
ncbi:MAG TPA: hypothetical protein VMD91_19610 [Candidatus Sulfotelmatobacter sp.]|nr:hypothetical protein [Candidatus Sulfotelmatobacter sp.]